MNALSVEVLRLCVSDNIIESFPPLFEKSFRDDSEPRRPSRTTENGWRRANTEVKAVVSDCACARHDRRRRSTEKEGFEIVKYK